MSDLFHEDVPGEFITEIFSTMAKAYWHSFQILTKRADRLVEIGNRLPWPHNVWQGVSVENQEHVYRIEKLKSIPAAIKFLSLEPLLGPIENLDLAGIDWVIVGGESGPGFRPMDEAWARSIRDQCKEAEVPFFFKQWGGRTPKSKGRMLDGRHWDEMPKPTRNVFSKRK
jgi:protein gp37